MGNPAGTIHDPSGRPATVPPPCVGQLRLLTPFAVREPGLDWHVADDHFALSSEIRFRILRPQLLPGRPQQQSLGTDGSDQLCHELAEQRITEGSLFFGAAHAFLLALSEVRSVRVVVLRMSRVATLDATGASVLGDAIRQLESRGISVILSGVRKEHARTLRQLGVYDVLATERHLFSHTPDAIAHARLHAARGRAPHSPPEASLQEPSVAS